MAEKGKKKKVKKLQKPVQKLRGNSHNPQHELLELLKTKCPEVFTEGKIDAAKLKQTLGEELDTNNERYGLSWAGKSECFHHIQETTTATLKSCRKESVDFDTTENIFIEGDNLEVLKILQKTYQNKIKMIYIDPPYNTGNDSFIYPDRFKEEKEDYEQRAGIKDAEGLLTKDGFWRKNSKDAGHFHSNWLSMIYPRLFLAKNLLREDGVIFVSIDDNEVHNLRMIMNEIFGEENFIACIANVNNPKGRSDDKFIATAHEYILVAAKNKSLARLYGFEPDHKITKRYSKKDAKGNIIREIDLRKTGDEDRREDRPDMFYYFYYDKQQDSLRVSKERNGRHGEVEIIPLRDDGKEGRWRWGFSTTEDNLDKLFAKFMPYRKIWGVFEIDYLEDRPPVKSTSSWTFKDVNSERGSEQFIELGFEKEVFPRPKPVGTMQRVIELGTFPNEHSVILDFFAGSCSLCHAAFSLLVENKRNSSFLAVQLPEQLDPNKKEDKAACDFCEQLGIPANIAEIGKERIRRAAKKIKEESASQLDFDKTKLDLGFKVFRLDGSNFKQWRENVKTGGELKEQMRMFVDNVKKGVAAEDMLFEIILKNSRFDLNVKIEKQSFDEIDYYRIADGVEIVCLAEKVTKKLVEKVLKEKPERFTCLDIAFKNNDQLKTNTALQMEAEKIDFKVI